MPQLDDRIALVTGSDSGIGQAIAEQFARAGADVAVTYHTDEAGAEQTRRRIEAAGRQACVHQLNLRDERSVERLFDIVSDALGTPDILVNNAGIGAGGTTVAETTTEEFDRVIKTDLYGPFFCSREFIRRQQLSATRKGKIT
jgi:glucose 1-dehydrogenase